jgi:glutamate dehydrogenase
MKKISQIINELKSDIKNSLKNNEQKHFSGGVDIFIDFLEIFYLQNSEFDFTEYSQEELKYLALSSFSFFSSQDLSSPAIQIYNPNKKEFGFDFNDTVIDIVNIDSPFLVDSTVALLQKNGLKVKNIIHPIYLGSREKGKIKKLLPASKTDNLKGFEAESVIQIHLEKIENATEIEALKSSIFKVISTVNLVVSEWDKMLNSVQIAKDNFVNYAKLVTKKSSSFECKEVAEFLSWLSDGNFIFLGCKELDIKKSSNGEYKLSSNGNSGFGVFNSPYEEMRPVVVNSSMLEVDDSIKNPYFIEILKSRYRSCVHMIANAERIRLQKFNSKGEVVGEYRFIGFFTSKAYNQSPLAIPLLRDKISKVISESGFLPKSYNYKELVSTLESYPRDELFQIGDKDLLRITTGIVSVCGRTKVRFFARYDKFNRFVSCLIFTPRDHSNSELRTKIKNYLSQLYQGDITDSFLEITQSNLVRFHLIIRTSNGLVKNNEQEIEKCIEKIIRPWSEYVKGAIDNNFLPLERSALKKQYSNAFSNVYSNRFGEKDVACDIANIEKSLKNNAVIFNLYQGKDKTSGNKNGYCELKIYTAGNELMLSDLMPILESFGFQVLKEATYALLINREDLVCKQTSTSKENFWIHYFQVNMLVVNNLITDKIKTNFEDATGSIFEGNLGIGSLNQLIIAAEFDWQQVRILRAYTKYLYQAGLSYSQTYVAEILINNIKTTKLLVELFATKFNPSLKISHSQRLAQIEKLQENISSQLNLVKDANEDIVIRKFIDLINATNRTNSYQKTTDGSQKNYISFKFDCNKIADLPLPKPFAEIFVYSQLMEGVHLRGGKVARGGIRWSDRNEDFRTEVLGLVKAQMTKNAVIVPVGSKGGFVVKKSVKSLTREQIMQDGISAYQTFLRGLLDVTDNVINGKVAHPERCIVHDEADPYLVVAADKGTATFSDIANRISAEYNFWLGDAFASGGSAGYDHKKMGITAKGAWISVKRHFRELGFDTQKQEFTAVGIGDLSGDVFGNGMLLSPYIKMVAAFNHLHIFLDPNPDCLKSFNERQRMFNLPRSSWADYDAKLISRGGGVFERSSKIVNISPEIQKVLNINSMSLTPDELIKSILKAPVDLLWNGGIGTYFKSENETNADVGDKNNDSLRINGTDLRCKVVGEGGNLGFTQKARIEYAKKGGRINTDAIDNSAGVDCSDHEVNIKICLTQALKDKKLNLVQRNKLLEEMTEEVSSLVLADNHLQTQAISIAKHQGIEAINAQSQFLSRIEKAGLLNRQIEFLPSKNEIDRRIGERQSLTRPELCVMLAYAKMEIYNSLLSGHLVDSPYCEKYLIDYFPKILYKKLGDYIVNHQLRREIIATQLTNLIVDKIGITFVSQIAQNRGFNINQIVKNSLICIEAFDLQCFWQSIEDLDGVISSDLQYQMFLSTRKPLERSVIWLLNNHNSKDIEEDILKFRKIVDNFSKISKVNLSKELQNQIEQKTQDLLKKNVSIDLAKKVASMDFISSAFELSQIDSDSKFDLDKISEVYFAVGEYFSLKWLRNKLSNINNADNWHKVSCEILLEDLYGYQIKISKKIVTNLEKFTQKHPSEKVDINNFINSWTENKSLEFERFSSFMADLKINSNPEIATFIVAINYLKSF